MPADDALPRSSVPSPSKKDETAVEHPLLDRHSQIPTFASSFDGALTRPGLRRQLRGGSLRETSATLAELVSSGSQSQTFSELDGSGLHDRSSTPGASSSASTPPEQSSHDDTKEVLVHKVQPTDSLAGVALRYGVKVAALRRANKLWPSDSIHLRKILYIPVGWQRQPKPIPISEADENTSEDIAITATERGSSTIQRVPASEFSFFPSRPSLFSDAEPILPPSPSSGSGTLPILSRRTVPNVIGIFSNSIDAIARMSTESLPSMGRTSTSEDPASSACDVELDLARATWRSTPTSAVLLPPPLLPPRTAPMRNPKPPPYRGAASNLIDSRNYRQNAAITDIQPKGKPPMTIPMSPVKR